MVKIFILTPSLRRRLKAPIGLLIRGSPEYTIKRLKLIVEREVPQKIIAVGDFVSWSMVKFGLSPNIMVVDDRIMRNPISPLKIEANHTLRVRNPAGTITDEAWEAIGRAMEMKGRVRVSVDGEEDLLTLAAVAHAPLGSIVVYGQPREGLVIVRVNERSKSMVRQILKEMKPAHSKN